MVAFGGSGFVPAMVAYDISGLVPVMVAFCGSGLVPAMVAFGGSGLMFAATRCLFVFAGQSAIFLLPVASCFVALFQLVFL